MECSESGTHQDYCSQITVKAGNAAIFEVYALPAFTNVASLSSSSSYTFGRSKLAAERPKVYIHL